MALPPRKQSGDAPHSARELNQIQDAARMAVGLEASRGLDTNKSPHGMAIAPQPTPEQVAESVQAVLTTATDGIIYGVVEVYDTLERYEGPALAECRQPTQSGFSRLGILLQGLGENEVGWVQLGGIVPLQFRDAQGVLAASATGGIGVRLGGRKSDHAAQPDQGGPFRVLQIPVPYVAADAGPPVVEESLGVAVVEIIGRRLDAKMIDADAVDATASGPYHTIIYGGALGVTKNSPGDITVA